VTARKSQRLHASVNAAYNCGFATYIQKENVSGRISMARFWKCVAFIVMLAAGDAYALASTRIIQPNAEPGDLMEGDQKLSCGAARDLLTRQGYQGVAVRSCFTFAYAFTVECNGKSVRVFVDPQNGRVWEG
jgi:hypothetical protein